MESGKGDEVIEVGLEGSEDDGGLGFGARGRSGRW